MLHSQPWGYSVLTHSHIEAFMSLVIVLIIIFKCSFLVDNGNYTDCERSPNSADSLTAQEDGRQVSGSS